MMKHYIAEDLWKDMQGVMENISKHEEVVTNFINQAGHQSLNGASNVSETWIKLFQDLYAQKYSRNLVYYHFP